MEKLTNEEIINKVSEFRRDAEMGNADLFARMTKAEKFKIGDQWNPQIRTYREKKNKFCLTIPLIKPTIKQVVGAQIQNPKDVTIAPTRGSSTTGARLRTRLVKHAMDSEHSVFELTQWFESGISSGIGFIGAFIDKHEDPLNGNLTIERMNEFECGLDNNCIAYDINSYMHGAKYFIWEPYVDKDLIDEMYPKQKDELASAGESPSMRDRTGLLAWLWDGLRQVTTAITGYRPAMEENLTKYKHRVTHTWWRRPKTCAILYVEGEPEYDALTLIKDKDIRDAKKLAKKHPDKLTLKEAILNVMYHTIRVGDVLLDHIEDEFNGVTKFPIGVFSAYFDNGYRAGMVEDMLGTQEEINWGHSQNLQVIKHLSTFHWKIKRDEDSTFAKWLATHADEDNLIIDESKGGGSVEKAQSKPYLSGLDRFVELAKENLKLISNVRTEEPAFDSKNMSGKAIALKQLSSQTGQAAVFQNYDYALNLFGQLVDEVITANEVYSPDEIRAIVEKDDLINSEMMAQARESVIEILTESGVEIPEPPAMNVMQMQGGEQHPAALQEMAQFEQMEKAIDELARPIAEDMLMEEIKNIRKGRYTTKVALSNYAPTARMAEHGEVAELNKSLIESGHAPLARKRLIEATDIKNKEEILMEDEAMQQQQMMMAATAGKGAA